MGAYGQILTASVATLIQVTTGLGIRISDFKHGMWEDHISSAFSAKVTGLLSNYKHIRVNLTYPTVELLPSILQVSHTVLSSQIENEPYLHADE